MSRSAAIFSVVYLGLLTLAWSKPIMVTFGTNQGPIIPESLPASTLKPKTIVARSPAPVSEDREDVPNPITYKPLVPHQYRTKLYSFKPPANLIFGTPLDQKFTPNLQKYNSYRKQNSRSLGLDYTGPHIFEKQAYEFFEPKKINTVQLQKYNKPHFYQQIEKRYDSHQQKGNTNNYNDGNNKFVPQIGIIYSAGVRYYVPQIVQNNYNPQQEDENSVYDRNDQKYYYYNNNNNNYSNNNGNNSNQNKQ